METVLQTPAIKNEPLAAPGRCLLNPATKRFDFLPDPLNDLLCFLYVFFQGLDGNKPAQLLAGSFGHLLFPTVCIMMYESYRQHGFLAKLGGSFLMLSQLAGAGVGIPLYFASVTGSRKAAVAVKDVSVLKPPSAEYAWSALLSGLIGYLGPSLFMAKEGQSYTSMALWQIFPVYIAIVGLLMPPILRPFLSKTPSAIPVFLIGLLGLLISAKGHLEILNSGEDFRDIVMLFWPKEATFKRQVHLFFLVDYVSTFLAVASHVIFSFESGMEEAWGYSLVVLLVTQFLGPGSAISILWLYRELYDYKKPLGATRKVVITIDKDE